MVPWWETNLNHYCDTPFWDSNVTWNTSDPELTTCFENTVLVWIPVIILLGFSPLNIYFTITNQKQSIPWNWLNISKIAITITLIIGSLYDFIYSVVHRPGVLAYSWTPIILLISFVLCLGLIIFDKVYGQSSSGLLFFFWIFLVLLNIPTFKRHITLISNSAASSRDVIYILSYILEVVVLLLNFFPDISTLEKKGSAEDSLEDKCSFPGKIIFSWYDKLVCNGYKRTLALIDLWNLNSGYSSQYVVPLFNKFWKQSINESKHNENDVSVIVPLFKAYGATFIYGTFMKLCQDLLSFTSPQLLRLLITFVDDNEYAWRGYLYAVLLFLSATVQTLLLAQYYNSMYMMGLKIKTALIASIYTKTLRISHSARKLYTSGEIVNLMAVDTQRLMDMMIYLNIVWTAPLETVLVFLFLWQLLGPSVLAGFVIMICLIPLNWWLSRKIKLIQVKQMTNKDGRIKLLNEILSGIKVLKLNVWEESFGKQIIKYRSKEAKVLRQSSYCIALSSMIWACAPYLVTLAIFSVYVLSDMHHVLDAKTTFVALSLINILRTPLTMVSQFITSSAQARVSLKRLNNFLNAEELDKSKIFHKSGNIEDGWLKMERGSFSWNTSSVVLKNITLSIGKGKLVAIVGSVGSGKSSLLSAFLGEMTKLSGTVNTKGSIAYVPQSAWIQNAPLKDNILFGKRLIDAFYERTVKACALNEDFLMLPNGDQTEIGERGINLSGGQKQRVSLARATYQDTDIYLLDDPLSAVDSHVGKHIFNNVIGPKGMLKKKTRLWVTNTFGYLPEVDSVVVLKGGFISEVGSYQDLIKARGDFSELVKMCFQEASPREEDLQEEYEDIIEEDVFLRSRSGRERFYSISTESFYSLSETDEVQVPKKIEKKSSDLITEETYEIGKVRWGVFKHYLSSMGVKWCCISLLVNTLYETITVGSSFWLSLWSSDKDILTHGVENKQLLSMYLGVYGLFGVLQGCSAFLADLMPMLGCWLAAVVLHNEILYRLLKAPMSFFDTTPMGRILSRFSKDVDILDNLLPRGICHIVWCTLELVGVLFVICYSTPIFMAVIIPIGLAYFFLQRFYAATSRQLMRLESVSRSPIYSHFSETISGVSSIRAYSVQARFIKDSQTKVDVNQMCLYSILIANRWLAVRIEMIGNLVIFFSALFAVIERNNMSAALVGLSVSFALQITQTLNGIVRAAADVETNIIAAERIKEYSQLPQEKGIGFVPGPRWPSEGSIELMNLKVKYREDLNFVLNGISCHIKAEEKIGIIGRTGAGKSSLSLSLFRIIEPSEGSISIDGVDISNLYLHSFRSQLTIIPQDAVLFSGTLRMNLDPECKFSDSEIWRALELSHLKNTVSRLPNNLHHMITERGENFSVGQRQLVCLARALLQKKKILILDEATASVDIETDELIQKTIRAEFADCTILTIAHRIKTIMDSDRIMILDNGLILEFDSPAIMLSSPNSRLKSFLQESEL